MRSRASSSGSLPTLLFICTSFLQQLRHIRVAEFHEQIVGQFVLFHTEQPYNVFIFAQFEVELHRVTGYVYLPLELHLRLLHHLGIVERQVVQRFLADTLAGNP